MDGQKDFFSVYFAGELFTHKDLAGNAMLAEAIYARSGGGFRCALPQNFEQRKSRPKGIRDEDILNLLECDLALFNYDGQELDSGTVVEFMFAKFADIPATSAGEGTASRVRSRCRGTSWPPFIRAPKPC